MGHSVKEIDCVRMFVQEQDDLDDSGPSIRIGLAELATDV